MGTPPRPIGVVLKGPEDCTALDQACLAEGIVIAGMGSTRVIRKTHTPLDPGMDLAVRQKKGN